MEGLKEGPLGAEVWNGGAQEPITGLTEQKLDASKEARIAVLFSLCQDLALAWHRPRMASESLRSQYLAETTS